MSEIKDTPWTVENVEYGDETSDDLCIIASSPSFRHIAHISPCYSGVRVPEMERAHANLMAAAPELLEALRDLIGWVPGPAHWHTDACPKAVDRAIAAIAKATGSQS